MRDFLPVIDKADGVQDESLCTTCGGRCCQRCAGIAFPDDFGDADTLVEVLVEYLSTGFWAVDCWDGDPRKNGSLSQVWYVRPAHKNAIGKLIDMSWGGVCRLWSADHGCSLEFNNRPRQCRTLVPHESFHCKSDGNSSKEDAALAWIPYQEQIEEAIRRCESHV